ncbi:MAG: MFS transporter [Peptococcaceae bacterium]|nr:MFS transporter [Peptococcaceae bacterium]
MTPYRFQWRALLMMVLAWGFAGLAHNCVAFLFPYFSEDFALGTAHNGYLTGTLAFFWTLSILICGPLAARIGQIRVIAPGMLLGGAALAALSLDHSVALLYICTAIAGFGCGTVVSPSFSFLVAHSDPKNRGLFFGASQSAFTLIGSAIGSLVFTRLGATSAGWQGCYAIMGGLIIVVALLIALLGRPIPHVPAPESEEEKPSFCLLFGYRNVVLSTILACLMMMWYFTTAAYTILYLMEARSLSAVAAGAIFAGFGSGGFIGEFAAPSISDRLGRKTTALLAVVIGTASFAAFVFVPMPALGQTLALAVAACFMSGAMAILNSVVPSESVPPHLVATATSFTPACGEFVGGVLAPVLAGVLAGTLGTSHVMLVLAALPLAVILGLLFLKETAPRILARREGK